MNVTADRLEFAPPPTAGLVRAIILALIAHALLIAALTWGVRWKRDDTIVTAQAELWSALPQTAAPKPVVVQPTPPTPPKPPPVVSRPVVTPPPLTPKVENADIALERDKQSRLEKEKQLAAEKLDQDKRKLQAEQKKVALEKQRELAAKMEKADQAEKLALDKKKAEQAAKQEKAETAEKLALDKKKFEQEAKRKELLKAEDASKQAAQAAQRADNLKRMAALAGSAGGPSATGTGLQNSGPSNSYGGRVSAKVKPNIVFTEDLAGNPTAEVEVRAAPDGTIVDRKLLKSSGSKSWDDAVLKAIDKTEVLPRDTDGRVPPVMLISFRPRD
jgi:colicin import membrane protein